MWRPHAAPAPPTPAALTTAVRRVRTTTSLHDLEYLLKLVGGLPVEGHRRIRTQLRRADTGVQKHAASGHALMPSRLHATERLWAQRLARRGGGAGAPTCCGRTPR